MANRLTATLETLLGEVLSDATRAGQQMVSSRKRDAMARSESNRRATARLCEVCQRRTLYVFSHRGVEHTSCYLHTGTMLRKAFDEFHTSAIVVERVDLT